MIKRSIQQDIVDALRRSPAVGLIGARQVGKTTLAKMIAKHWPGKTLYLDLELPEDYSALAQPQQFLENQVDKLVIIDEIQQKSDLFPVLRGLIDKDRRPARFLLLGSSSPDLMRQSGQSLAGRISYHELSPFLLNELPKDQTNLLWTRGGFPRSTLAKTEAESVDWREDFIMTYLQRDLSAMGYDIRIPALTLRRFWQMLAHNHGQLANLSQLAVNLDLSRQSIRKYLDILQETFMVRRLEPYHANLKKRLIKTFKIYLRDSGIVHSLLGIKSFEELMSHSIVGMSWEGFCIEQVLNQIPKGWDAFFYRTRAQAEVDLVLQKGFGQPPIMVEMKLSKSPKPTKGFWVAYKDLKPQASYIVYLGSNAYPLTDKVEVLPLTHIERIWNQ